LKSRQPKSLYSGIRKLAEDRICPHDGVLNVDPGLAKLIASASLKSKEIIDVRLYFSRKYRAAPTAIL
jgi:hypothetical protein